MALQYIPGRAISLTSQAAGDVAYYNGTEWIRLAKGTAGQQLAINSGAIINGKNSINVSPA